MLLAQLETLHTKNFHPDIANIKIGEWATKTLTQIESLVLHEILQWSRCFVWHASRGGGCGLGGIF